MIITINTPNINVSSFEHIIHEINETILTIPRNKNICLDISTTHFIDPYSIINFCLLLKYLGKFFSNISLSLPKDTNVHNYLERMNFFRNIPNGIILLNKPISLYSKRQFSTSDVLLELTNIQKQNDVYNVIDYSIKKIGQILQTSLGYNEMDITLFCTALSETCQNIIDHSENQGLVSVQKYHKDTDYVVMAISDLGIGIKRSLANRYDVIGWNHARAIQYALQLGTSRFPDRGKGLYRVIEIVKKYKGKLTIRSCSGRIEIGKIITPFIVPHFPGTQLYIKLHKPKDFS